MSSLLHQSIAVQSRLAQSQADLANQTAQLAKQMNIHAPSLISWKIVADAINSPEKRAKAKKAIDALSQRKLGEYI
jgi:acetyl-CoA carboxylase alpha subunit